MGGWTRCLHCETPVIGTARHEARFCKQRCLEEGMLEAVRLEAELGLGRFEQDDDRTQEERIIAALDDVPLLHRWGLLQHGVAAWRDVHGDLLDDPLENATADEAPPTRTGTAG